MWGSAFGILSDFIGFIYQSIQNQPQPLVRMVLWTWIDVFKPQKNY